VTAGLEAAAAAEAGLPDASASTRRVWVLVDGRSGDDAQIRRIAAALGWPTREVPAKRSIWETAKGRAADAFGTWPPAAGMAPADAPPWPDLLLASGAGTFGSAARTKAPPAGQRGLGFWGAPNPRPAILDRT